jgi:hypothetical protein
MPIANRMLPDRKEIKTAREGQPEADVPCNKTEVTIKSA